jgi:Sigma-70, region 4
MPPRAVNAFERLAPDQRAAVELVLRGRSYAELGSLLGIPEQNVRSRAHDGLEALAPDLPPPARAGEVADWLLGQGDEPRDLDGASRRWAETIAAPLRDLDGAKVPALPWVADAPAASSDAATPAATTPASPPPDTPAPSTTTPAAPGRSSRLGGAILIGAAVVVIAGVLVFVLTRGGDDNKAAGTGTPAPTAAATGTPQAQAGDIVLRGPAGSKAIGLMRLFKANDDTVRFALAAQDVEPNKGKDTYSLWFRKKDGSAVRLGVAQNPVGSGGTLTTAGPRNEDVDKFPEWFASYDTVLVSLDSSPTAKKPGTVILSGDLPHASG